MKTKILVNHNHLSRKEERKNPDKIQGKKCNISQKKNENSPKVSPKESTFNFKNEIAKLFLVFQKLTLFTTRYSCKNYSQFIFGITKGFVSYYTKMKIQLTKNFESFGRTTQVRKNFFSELEKEFLQKIEYIVCPQKLNSQLKFMHEKQQESFLSNSANQKQFDYELHQEKQSPDYQQNTEWTNHKQNREIFFVCSLLLQIPLDQDPKKTLKLAKRIIAKELENLYSHSRQLIKQNIENLVIAICQSMVSKFNQNGFQSGISFKEYEKLRKKILFYEKKSNKKEKIKEILKKRAFQRV